MKRYMDIFLGLVLLGSFFTPWSKFFGLKGSGLELATSPQIQGGALFVIPAVSALFLISRLMSKGHLRGLQMLTGLLPLIGFIGGLVFIGQKTNSSPFDAFSNVKAFLDWGVYLALSSGLALFISAMFKPRGSRSV